VHTEVADGQSPDNRAATVAAAVALLRAGETVALPTETVYGLAADALNPDAVLKIFAAKERPRFDPLIVHVPTFDWLRRVARLNGEDSDIASRLAENFWPGPLTLVFPRTDLIADVVTAGLDTVAVRMSAHPLFSDVLRAFAKPVAAPSANRFGRISPTAAAHVLDELNGRIPLIVDGGPTTHGIESTVVAVRGANIEILRPGPVTRSQLSVFAEIATTSTGKIEAPGQLRSHYAPRTQVVVAEDLEEFVGPPNVRCGLLVSTGKTVPSGFAEIRRLSETGDLREAASNLFRCLRELDQSGVDLIVAEAVRDHGLGSAIMDRLRRAAAAAGPARQS
jgi:L-threonylcarbamoyladenylate synthase